MSSRGVGALVCLFGSITLSAVVGCAFSPPVSGNGVDDLPVPGEEGAVCLADGTCNEGLECIDDVCVAIDGEGEDGGGDEGNGDIGPLLIFHNNSGPMCLAALDWLESVKPEHPALVVEEHLTYEAGEVELLAQLEAQFQASQGLSTNFGYLPIMFFQDQAFSGFNDEIAEALEGLLDPATSASP